jgi:hypothetical protein
LGLSSGSFNLGALVSYTSWASTERFNECS